MYLLLMGEVLGNTEAALHGYESTQLTHASVPPLATVVGKQRPSRTACWKRCLRGGHISDKCGPACREHAKMDGDQ